MWTCPKCSRNFKTTNQSHTCSNIEIGELFMNKPDGLVLAFDKLLTLTADLYPNTIGTAKNSVVFTSKKAWLIVKPMKTQLDIKFYYFEQLDSELIHKITPFGKKFGHHLRVQDESEITERVWELILRGYKYSLN